MHQDPVLSRVKLIAEPWDVGPGGYRVGGFPPRWSEWNDHYRDTMRDFWRAQTTAAAFATRLTGSSDLYGTPGRSPTASVDFITAHDGFTLADLVSYEHKHNEANLEENHDGNNDNRSWNCGAEGPTRDPRIRALRAQQQRNMLATLLLSQGIPMLVAGDERGRTQGGNNNAWCQDNEVSWLDWDETEAASELAPSRGGCLRSARATRCSGAPASSTAAPPSRCSRTRGGSVPTAGRWPSATGTSCDTSASS